MPHNPKLRFGMSLAEATSANRFNPSLANAPPLPVVDFSRVGAASPQPIDPGSSGLPQASTVVICWTEAEWAALQHVFCAGSTPLAYSTGNNTGWPDWQRYSQNLSSGAPSGWDYWGEYRLVQVNGKRVLLFKSNTHLDYPGPAYLEKMISLLIAGAQPALVMSTGTAGGAKPTDHIGTVRAVSAGTLYESAQPQATWPTYSNPWQATDTILDNLQFGSLLNPVPTSSGAMEALVSQFNQYYNTEFNLEELDPLGLNIADAVPHIIDQTGGTASLLTTPTFAIANTAGNFAAYSAVEMDDAIIGKACGATTAFAFVRNLSDPAQAVGLPSAAQKNWGSAVYDLFGFYTSFNGAIAAWAIVNG